MEFKLSQETIHEIFSDEVIKIINENESLKEELDVLKQEKVENEIRQAINGDFSFYHYLGCYGTINALLYVTSRKSYEVYDLYLKLIHTYGVETVDKVIDKMIVEAQINANV